MTAAVLIIAVDIKETQQLSHIEFKFGRKGFWLWQKGFFTYILSSNQLNSLWIALVISESNYFLTLDISALQIFLFRKNALEKKNFIISRRVWFSYINTISISIPFFVVVQKWKFETETFSLRREKKTLMDL